MKDKILTTATSMFLDLGFKSVTMDDISNSLGISKKTIYSHFRNKEKLVEAVSVEIYNNIAIDVDSINQKQQNSIQELFDIKDLVIRNFKSKNHASICQLQKFFPEIHFRMQKKHYEVITECLTKNIKKGVEEEYYRTNLNIDFVVEFFFAGMNVIKNEDSFLNSKYDKNYLVTAFLEYHTRAIATKKGINILNQILTNHKN